MDEIVKLKAKAYDILATIQKLQQELQAVNQRITELIKNDNKTVENT